MSISNCYGQNRAILQLQRARQGHRLPHSYIFHGPEGVGKGFLAREWSKLLLCASSGKRTLQVPGSEDVEIDDCCDSCEDCRSVQALSHPDLHIINRDLARFTSVKRSRQLIAMPIDVIREFVIKPSRLAPSRGRARIFIIEEAQTMNRSSQNALLKTLEEPPRNTFLLLITSGPEMFLPTVRSRCQSVRFQPLSYERVHEQLVQAGVSDEQGRFWADFSEGRLGVALELAQMSIYELKCELVMQLSQLSDQTALDISAWLLEKAKQIGKSYLSLHPEHSAGDATRLGQRYLLQMISHAFSQALRMRVQGPDQDVQGLDQPMQIAGLAGIFAPESCGMVIREAYRTERLFQLNVNPALLFDSFMIKCLNYAQE